MSWNPKPLPRPQPPVLKWYCYKHKVFFQKYRHAMNHSFMYGFTCRLGQRPINIR